MNNTPTYIIEAERKELAWYRENVSRWISLDLGSTVDKCFAIHIKTGNVYNVVGHVINATNEQSGQAMVAYERDGQRYVREAAEFSSKFSTRTES